MPSINSLPAESHRSAPWPRAIVTNCSFDGAAKGWRNAAGMPPTVPAVSDGAYASGMPITTGFNHVATLTTDMDRTVRFYQDAFDAVVTFEMAKRDDHPWMKIIDLGGGAGLNIFEVD